MKVTLTSGKVVEVADPAMAEYLKLKHEVFKVGEGEVLPDELREHPARIAAFGIS